MRIAIATLLVLVAPGFALAHSAAESGAEPRAVAQPALAEVSAVVDGFHKSLSNGDRAAALALLDERVQIYEQGWVERSSAEYGSHHLDDDIEFSRATTQTTTARSGLANGDQAYVATEGRNTGTFRGKAIDSVTLETVVLHRLDGKWRITHIHWSSRAAQKP